MRTAAAILTGGLALAASAAVYGAAERSTCERAEPTKSLRGSYRCVEYGSETAPWGLPAALVLATFGFAGAAAVLRR